MAAHARIGAPASLTGHRRWWPTGRMELDHRLAAGADPLASPALARRAAILLTQRTRRRLAIGLEKVVLEAEKPRPRSRVSAAIPVQRRAVLDARSVLLVLAAALRTAPDPLPRGIAAASVLLTDGAGPLFVEHPPNALRDAARQATSWVEAV